MLIEQPTIALHRQTRAHLVNAGVVTIIHSLVHNTTTENTIRVNSRHRNGLVHEGRGWVWLRVNHDRRLREDRIVF